MTWGEFLTLLLVGLGFFYIVVTKMRQTERGRKATDWFFGLFNKFKREDKPIPINTGGSKWIPAEKII